MSNYTKKSDLKKAGTADTLELIKNANLKLDDKRLDIGILETTSADLR